MTAAEILKKANEMRRGNRAYTSNAFYTISQLEEFIKNKQVSVLEQEDLILLLERDGELYRVQYFARNAQALAAIPALLPQTEDPVMADVVGRGEAASHQAQQLSITGFAPYKTFVRMVCTKPVLPRPDGAERVELAQPQDVDEIYGALYTEFDPMFAHIPEKDELLTAVDKGEISVIRGEGDLAGFAYFEHISEKYAVLRYFIVNPNYRGQNVAGALLYSEFIHDKPGTVYMLWVGTYNKAQGLYQKYNFQYDGLTDYILKFEG